MDYRYDPINKFYQAIAKNDPKDKVELEIGDSKDSTTFQPQLKIMRWDDEVNFSLRFLTDSIPGVQAQTLSNGVIEYSKGQYKARFYEKSEGYEFEIEIPRKPPVNSIGFSINTKELDYFYQPELTQEEIDEGCFRPENIVGSYAVYHKTKGVINRSDGKEYKNGKALHIYRPQCVDANGNKIWADLNINEQTGLLTITVDQTWLNNAIYPVIVDPTFGTDATTPGTMSVAGANWFDGSLFTAPSDVGAVSKCSIYYNSANCIVGMKAAIVLHSDLTIVTNGIGGVTTSSFQANPSWGDSTFSSQPTLTPSTAYLLGMVQNRSGSPGGGPYYDAGSADQSHNEIDNNYTTPTNPTSITHGTRKWGIYATYTAGASEPVTQSDLAISSFRGPPGSWAIANFVLRPSQNVSAKANISVSVSNTNLAKINFKAIAGSTNVAQVNIVATYNQTVSSIANFLEVNIPPTVELGSPLDDATGVSINPALIFTGTDNNEDAIRYQAQVFQIQPNALALDGTGDYVEVSDNNDFSVPTTGEITISIWIKPSVLDFPTAISSADGDFVHFLSKYDTTDQIEWAFRMYSKTGSLRPNRISFYLFNPEGGTGVGSYFEDPVTADEWIHVVAAVDSTSTYIYKNGIYRDSDVYTATITPTNTTSPVRIGTDNATSFFQGSVARVEIWNRKLTSQEVAEVYNFNSPSTGRVGFWDMHEGAGASTTDVVNSRSGSFNGNTSWTTGLSAPGSYANKVMVADEDARTYGDTWPGDGGGVATATTWASEYIGAATTVFYLNGFMFRSLPIPKGATITSAVLSLCSTANVSTTTNVNIYGGAEDNASAFNLTDREPRDISRTTENVNWNIGTAAWTLGTYYNTPDLSSVVQAIVDRANWSEGNNLSLFIANNATTLPGASQRRQVDQGSSATPPLLTVTYTVPPFIDVVSDTDQGFSGTPDNEDPFASGQSVTFTVPAGSELSNGVTYSWRVRGIDPTPGSNTYGSWSETRSFTVIGSSSLAQNNIVKANILASITNNTNTAQVNLSKTPTDTNVVIAAFRLLQSSSHDAKACILAVQTKTNVATSNILTTGSYTNVAKVDFLTPNVVKNFQSIANFSRRLANSQLSIINIRKTVSYSDVSLVNISQRNTVNNVSKINISVSTAQVNSAKSNLKAASSDANSAKANFSRGVNISVVSLSNITTTNSVSNIAIVNIGVLTTKTNMAVFNLIGVLDQFHLITPNNAAFIGSNTGQKAGQQFTPTVSKRISQIVVQLTKLGAPTDNVICDLYTLDANGQPDIFLDTADNVVSATDVPSFASMGYFQFNFANSHYLRSGVKYAFVLRRSGDLNDSNVCGLGDSSTGPLYAGGDIVQYNGNDWVVATTLDAYFKEYYNYNGILGYNEVLSISNISVTASANNFAKISISQSASASSEAIASIKSSYQKSNISVANIIASGADTNVAKFDIKATSSNSCLSLANFSRTSSVNLLSRASFSVSVSQSNLAKVNISRTVGPAEEIVDESQLTGSTSVGWGEFTGVRYRGQGFIVDNALLTAVAFQRNKGSKGIKIYIDTADSDSLPTHAVGSEIYSFVIANASLTGNYQKFTLPVAQTLIPSDQYCFYVAPWDTVGNAYADDYQDGTFRNANVYDRGKSGANNNGTWSVSDSGNLDMKFEIYTTGYTTTSFAVASFSSAVGFANTSKVNIVGVVTQSNLALSNISLSGRDNVAKANIQRHNWVQDTMDVKQSRWSKISAGGTLSFTSVGGDYGTVARLVSPGSGEIEVHRNYNPYPYYADPYRGFQTVDLDIDLHGATLIGGDASAFGWDQSGWQYVSLSSYVTQGQDGWQHISIPLTDFTGLDTTAETGFLLIKIWHDNVITVDIDNIEFRGAAYVNYTQPALPAVETGKRWNFQSVDTMKWSKDTLAGQKTQEEINSLIAADAGLNLTHVAVSTPYDDASDYSPAVTAGYKQKFITAIRNSGLKVWHRQHWNEWEGDYADSGFSKTTPRTTPSRALGDATQVILGQDTTSWLYKTYNYILTHASEFAAGDIFTPVCEVENGGTAGGETDQFANYAEVRQFMRDSLTVCNEAFKQIGLGGQIFVGFWSNNGYTLLNRLDERTAEACTYNTVDHYVWTGGDMTTDLNSIYSYYGVPIMIGEWGQYNDADILTRAFVTQDIYKTFSDFKEQGKVIGVNYWDDIGGGNESILDASYQLLLHGKVVQSYFNNYTPYLSAAKASFVASSAITNSAKANIVATTTVDLLSKSNILQTYASGFLFTGWDNTYNANVLPENSGITFATYKNPNPLVASTIEINPAGILHVIGNSAERFYWNRTPLSFTNAEGCCYEARLRVVSSDVIANADYRATKQFHIAIANNEAQLGVSFYSDGIFMSDLSGLSYQPYSMDTTDDYHVYRITLRNYHYCVYVDGTLVAEGTSTLLPSDPNVIFGYWGGVTSEVLLDYLSYDNTGIHQPVISSKANIVAANSQNNFAKSNLQRTSSNSNVAITSFSNTLSVALESVANILSSQTKNNIAIGYVFNVGQCPNTARFDILTVDVVKSNSAKVNFSRGVTDSHSALASFKRSVSATNAAKFNASRTVVDSNAVKTNISVTRTTSNISLARIYLRGLTASNIAKVNIRRSVSDSNVAKVNISKLVTDSQSAKLNISKINSDSHNAKADIIATLTKTNSVLASLSNAGQQPNSAQANILVVNNTKNNLAVVNISNRWSFSNIASAYLIRIETKNVVSLANISVPTNRNNVAKFNSVRSVDNSQQSQANLVRSWSSSVMSVVNISRRENNGNIALINFFIPSIQDNLVLVNIQKQQTKNNVVKFNIFSFEQKFNSAVVNISRTADQSQTSLVNISNSLLQTQVALVNLQVQQSCNNLALSNFSVQKIYSVVAKAQICAVKDNVVLVDIQNTLSQINISLFNISTQGVTNNQSSIANLLHVDYIYKKNGKLIKPKSSPYSSTSDVYHSKNPFSSLKKNVYSDRM